MEEDAPKVVEEVPYGPMSSQPTDTNIPLHVLLHVPNEGCFVSAFKEEDKATIEMMMKAWVVNSKDTELSRIQSMPRMPSLWNSNVGRARCKVK
ncbi:hypothetical protein ABZP36_015961 [Zizania latifolia]